MIGRIIPRKVEHKLSAISIQPSAKAKGQGERRQLKH
jgi:hypothetical protein